MESRRDALQITIGTGYPPEQVGDDRLVFFSDGSITDRGNKAAKTGIGVVRPLDLPSDNYESRSYYTSPLANIAQCELLGIKSSLEWALSLNATERERHRNILICCDSQAALRAIGQAYEGFRGSTRLVHEILQLIERWTDHSNISSHIGTPPSKVYLWWVKGHAGHLFNELADISAGRGARRAAGAAFLNVQIPQSATRREIVQHAEVQLEMDWRQQRGSLAIARFGLGLGRKQINRITRHTLKWKPGDRRRLFEMLSFHSPTRSFVQHLSRGNGGRRCRHCGIYKETLAHFVWCASLRMSRVRKEIWVHDPLYSCSAGERTAKGMALIRECLIGKAGEIYRLRKFLARVAPKWGEGKKRRTT